MISSKFKDITKVTKRKHITVMFHLPLFLLLQTEAVTFT